ncbi:hypothetical protein R3P38DRAFT_3378635 [Favolaschia claudopus]|uniref:Uncharacterized protein n=1 Tax=Favolaschia claudopus TaxID=2862362 RepID=A0AAV9Z9N5_9AGAR
MKGLATDLHPTSECAFDGETQRGNTSKDAGDGRSLKCILFPYHHHLQVLSRVPHCTSCPAPPPAKPAPCTIQALPRHVVLDTTKSILRQEYHGGDTLPSAIHALFSGGHGTENIGNGKAAHALHSRRRASLTAPRFVVLSPGARRASYMGVPLDGLWPAGCYDSAATRVLSLTMNGREKSDDGNKPVDRDIILAGEGRGRGRLDFVADGGTWRLFPISRIVY